MNQTIIIGAIIVTIILFDALRIAYAESISWTYYPGKYDWIRQILASNPNIALGAFIVVVGGILSHLGYTIYKIFFK